MKLLILSLLAQQNSMIPSLSSLTESICSLKARTKGIEVLKPLSPCYVTNFPYSVFKTYLKHVEQLSPSLKSSMIGNYSRSLSLLKILNVSLYFLIISSQSSVSLSINKVNGQCVFYLSFRKIPLSSIYLDKRQVVRNPVPNLPVFSAEFSRFSVSIVLSLIEV